MKVNRFAIELRMAELQMTQKELAERAGICGGNHVSKVLHRGTASPIFVGKIAGVLGVAVRDIVVEE